MSQREFDRARPGGRPRRVTGRFGPSSDALKSAHDNRTVRQVQAEVNQREVAAAKGPSPWRRPNWRSRNTLFQDALDGACDGSVDDSRYGGENVHVGEADVGIVDDSAGGSSPISKRRSLRLFQRAPMPGSGSTAIRGGSSRQGAGRRPRHRPRPRRGSAVALCCADDGRIRLRRRLQVTIRFDRRAFSRAVHGRRRPRLAVR